MSRQGREYETDSPRLVVSLVFLALVWKHNRMLEYLELDIYASINSTSSRRHTSFATLSRHVFDWIFRCEEEVYAMVETSPRRVYISGQSQWPIGF